MFLCILRKHYILIHHHNRHCLYRIWLETKHCNTFFIKCSHYTVCKAIFLHECLQGSQWHLSKDSFVYLFYGSWLKCWYVWKDSYCWPQIWSAAAVWCNTNSFWYQHCTDLTRNIMFDTKSDLCIAEYQIYLLQCRISDCFNQM